MLKFKLDNLDGLEDPLKALYAKGDDGKFVLQVDETGAKSALQKERDAREAAERALKERDRADADTKATKEREELERKGDYEKLKASLEADKANLAKAKEHAEVSLRSYIAKAEVTAAVAAAKGVPELILPHVMDKVEVVADGDSHKVLVKGGGTLPELLETLKSNPTYARAFDASGASGGGTNPGGAKGPAPANTVSRGDSRAFLANVDKIASGQVAVK